MAKLAIDPSLAASGYVIFDNDDHVLDLNVIKTIPKYLQSKRLSQIYTAFASIVSRYEITEVVSEDQFVNTGLAGNKQVALILSRARGVIMLATSLLDIPFVVYTPAEIKKTVTGKGNASKDKVRESVLDLYGNQEIVLSQLTSKGKVDDMADALAIYHTHKLLKAGRAS